MRRTAVLGALTALALAAALLPAAGHPVNHTGQLRIVNLRPAPGEVVAAGSTNVAALAVSDAAITSHELVIDGQPTSAARSGDAHPTVAATVALAPGEHIARLTVTDAAGRRAERAWRFTASPMPVERIFGSGRVETAVALSEDLYPAMLSAGAAVLARADDYPDALAGVPLAHARDGPLLLTGRDRLADPVAAELRRVLPPGATVYLLGGEAALSDRVEADVRTMGYLPQRLAGASRHATAALIADELEPSGAAVIASGRTFADALAVSAPAARNGWPVLLTEPDSLPAETRAALDSHDPEQIYVIGGGAAVGPEVVDRLREHAPVVQRISGAGRYDTAAAVVEAFSGPAEQVAIASGEAFPDALAGGRHAAGLGVPLLLSARGRLPDQQADQIGALGAGAALLYGGPAALSDGVATDARRAHLDHGAARITAITPAAGVELTTLDQVLIRFDREIEVEHSVLYVAIGGHEVPGTVDQGEFPDALVYTATELPTTIVPGERYPLRVTGAAYDGQRWRRIDHRLAYRKLDLARGDSGALVRDLQQRLTAQGYWLGTLDGVYGTLTHQAVLAFQKAHRLPRDGVYNSATRRLLESDPPRPTPRSGPGTRAIEIDLDRQILMVVQDGVAQWTFNTSTGHGSTYTFQGATYRATTTTGVRRITRQIDGMREAERGLLWRPKYFDDSRGIAIHGSTSVPAYPASAGCVRLTYAAMDFLWNAGLAPIGTTVWVYPEGYYG
jgi:putative cell wall-binding protein